MIWQNILTGGEWDCNICRWVTLNIEGAGGGGDEESLIALSMIQ